MSAYILILWWMAAGVEPVAIYFNSKAACEAASAALRDETYRPIIALCVAKG